MVLPPIFRFGGSFGAHISPRSPCSNHLSRAGRDDVTSRRRVQPTPFKGLLGQNGWFINTFEQAVCEQGSPSSLLRSFTPHNEALLLELDQVQPQGVVGELNLGKDLVELSTFPIHQYCHNTSIKEAHIIHKKAKEELTISHKLFNRHAREKASYYTVHV